MVRCSPIPATCTAGHQRIVLSSASSMQSLTGYDSSLDFLPDEHCGKCNRRHSLVPTILLIPPSYFPIGCGSDRTIKISQSAIFLHAIREIDRLTERDTFPFSSLITCHSLVRCAGKIETKITRSSVPIRDHAHVLA